MTDIQKMINAVRHGKVPPLKVLIEDENVDMYLTDSLGKNILHHAAIEGKEEILRWLIETKSYDINIKDTIGMKMINYAALRKTKVAKSTEKKDVIKKKEKTIQDLDREKLEKKFHKDKVKMN